MKKLFCLILCAVLLLCGCANTADPNTYSSATDPQAEDEILAQRRDLVEAEMRKMSAVLWTPAEDITYSLRSNSLGPEMDILTGYEDVITLYAGRIYQGIPYTHGSGSCYSFLSYATSVDENGVYTLSGLDGESLNGIPTNNAYNCARIGNDCADQLFWAWGQVSSSIFFPSTAYMTEYYGCLKVGDYEYTGISFSADNNTRNIVKNNGQQRMFAAYAQMLKGDGLVLINPSGAGHAVMNVRVHVEYLADGTIDGDNSYAVILEQTSGPERSESSYYNESLGQTVYLCEVLDKKWDFNTLFKKGYLPVTCKELVDPAPLEPAEITDRVDTPAPENMFTGAIEANFRISSVTITVTDEAGNPVQQATCYGHQEEMYRFSLSRFINPAEQSVMQGGIDLNALTPGSYRCTYVCQLSTGENITFRDFAFTV